MTEEGQRILFEDAGPYLLEAFEAEPEAMLLDDHPVCLLQFGGVYLPVALEACPAMAETLGAMRMTDMGPEREGMIPVAFDGDEAIELPLLTEVGPESFQYGDMVYLDVFFGPTRARLCLSVIAAATVARIVSQIPRH